MNYLYTLWPSVPVMYADCQSKEDQLKHRIRRAIEKADDYALDSDAFGACLLDKLLDIDWLAEKLVAGPPLITPAPRSSQCNSHDVAGYRCCLPSGHEAVDHKNALHYEWAGVKAGPPETAIESSAEEQQ